MLGMEERPKSNKLSPNTLEILYRENLLETYSRDQEAAFEGLMAAILLDPKKQRDPRRLYAAAEFANVLAERKAPAWNRRPTIQPRGRPPGAEGISSQKLPSFLSRNQDALKYYGLASYLSYGYLSVASTHLNEEAFDPRFRQACEIYNYSLEQTLRFTLDAMPFDPRFFYRLDDPSGLTKARFKLVGFDWKEEDIHDLLPAIDHRTKAIGPTSRRKGLGVPLIGIHYEDGKRPGVFYPPLTAFPVTALQIPIEEFDLEATESRELVHLVNPWNQETLKVGNQEIPVEADLSTPLHYMLEKTGFNSRWWEGFITEDEAFTGAVFLIQPHRPGRIPVVLCHGLLSSPGPWETLINGLMDDPWIRQNYEFWLMQYPTGRGMLVNAYYLRKAMTEVRTGLDPNGTDPALDRIVFVGHSMGGSIGTLLSHDSGNVLWDAAWSVPIDQLDLSPSEREELANLFFFERLPFIKRVVYLATPHHGAPLASRPIGWIGTQIVDLPQRWRSLLKTVNDRNQQYAKIPLNEDSLTSVSQLRAGSPVSVAMANLDNPGDVVFHNIAGDIASRDGQRTDGTVPLSSATIDWADTSLVVPARHTEIQRHPLTIQAIHEILLEHARDLRQDPEMGGNPAETFVQSATPESVSPPPSQREIEEIGWESSSQ